MCQPVLMLPTPHTTHSVHLGSQSFLAFTTFVAIFLSSSKCGPMQGTVVSHWLLTGSGWAQTRWPVFREPHFLTVISLCKKVCWQHWTFSWWDKNPRNIVVSSTSIEQCQLHMLAKSVYIHCSIFSIPPFHFIFQSSDLRCPLKCHSFLQVPPLSPPSPVLTSLKMSVELWMWLWAGH